MKEILERHINNILTTLQIKETVEVYDCTIDVLPEWTKQIQLTHEFLISCNDITEKQKLQAFIGKTIFQFQNYNYWFEGDRTNEEEQVVTDNIDEETNCSINYLKTNTQLPAWLDDYIFKQLNAEYAPNFQKFDLNLDLTKDENLKYLGTYFPRSYAESFCIFDNIFQNNNYIDALHDKKSINILSVGCGTGGDLIGLLTVVVKYCSKISDINIWTLDGNIEALSIAGKIIEKFKVQFSRKINVKTIHLAFESVSDINDYHIGNIKFDFILSFKLLNEIIALGQGKFDNSYYTFIHKFAPMLSDSGLCVLLDVTTKSKHTTYNPILLNRQVNQALKELTRYKTLLPISCELYGDNCNLDCFCQKTFTVTHSNHINDKSKVAYRVIAHIDLKTKIVNTDNQSRLLIYNDKVCPHTENNNYTEDAFLLNLH
jgi:hypothetical protein